MISTGQGEKSSSMLAAIVVFFFLHLCRIPLFVISVKVTLSRPHLIFSANLGDHPSQGLDVLLKLLHLVHVLPEQ